MKKLVYVNEKQKMRLDQSGLTFIELLITLAVVSLAILGFVGTNTLIQRNSEGIFERAVAVQDANQVIEQMRDAASSAPEAFQSDVISRGTSAIASVGSLPANHNESIAVTYVDTTAEFDEYTVVLKGTLHVKSNKETLEIHAGQAIIVKSGEWVEYSTPGPEGAEYIAVCLPAFSPNIVHRDK